MRRKQLRPSTHRLDQMNQFVQVKETTCITDTSCFHPPAFIQTFNLDITNKESRDPNE